MALRKKKVTRKLRKVANDTPEVWFERAGRHLGYALKEEEKANALTAMGIHEHVDTFLRSAELFLSQAREYARRGNELDAKQRSG